jgi:hypothetical protein
MEFFKIKSHVIKAYGGAKEKLHAFLFSASLLSGELSGGASV